MLVSQLNDGNVPQQPPTSAHHAEEPRAAAAAAAGVPSPAPENFSNHTRVWSELSGVYLFGKLFSLAISLPQLAWEKGFDVVVVLVSHWYGHT
jgi:uncharacterized protein (DUF2336 family)